MFIKFSQKEEELTLINFILEEKLVLKKEEL